MQSGLGSMVMNKLQWSGAGLMGMHASMSLTMPDCFMYSIISKGCLLTAAGKVHLQAGLGLHLVLP
jgi:hypothetical protein